MIENLEHELIDAMLDSMPIEISFIDENDEVRYFNKNGDRIFPRPRSIVDKKVQQCHPQKSLHKVIQIIEAFRSGIDKESLKVIKTSIDLGITLIDTAEIYENGQLEKIRPSNKRAKRSDCISNQSLWRLSKLP